MAVLLNERTSAQDLVQLLQALQAQGVHSKLLYSRMGEVIADDGSPLPIAGTFAGSPSLTVDAVVVPGGDLSALSQSGDARYYLLEAYKHLKPILLAGDARQLTSVLHVPTQGEEGVIVTDALDTPAAGQTARPDDGPPRVVEKPENRRYSGVVKSPARCAGLDSLSLSPVGLTRRGRFQTITPGRPPAAFSEADVSTSSSSSRG
ncbi:RpoS-dependent hydroperoxidase II [Klebsiella pneumoniae]|nr:RpoS-dependent hydroperoxidase II [Klebsiella pneumoniae]